MSVKKGDEFSSTIYLLIINNYMLLIRRIDPKKFIDASKRIDELFTDSLGGEVAADIKKRVRNNYTDPLAAFRGMAEAKEFRRM